MSLLRLSIVGFPGGYEFGLEGDGRSFLESVDFARAELDNLEQQWARLRPDLDFDLWRAPSQDTVSRWASLSQALGRCLPDELVDALKARRYKNLNLVLDDPLGLPWGRAQVGSDCLVDGWCLTRGAHHVTRTEERGRPRALVIGNPDGTFPDSDKLADKLSSLLESRFETLKLQGAEATVSRVKAELEKPYVVLVLSCFVESGTLTHRALLHDGFLCFSDIKGSPQLPRLALFNILSTTANDVDFLAASLIKAGVQAMLIPKWAAPGTGRVLQATLTSMAEGLPVAKALRQGRSTWYQEHPKEPYRSDHSLELWGNPDFTLPVARERSVTVQSALTTSHTLLARGPDFELEFPIFEQALLAGKKLYLGKPGPQLNQLELPDPELPNRLGYFEHAQEGLHLVSLDDKLRLNGLPVRGSSLFQPGDVLEMAGTRIEFKHTEADEPERPQAAALLRVLNGTGADHGKSLEMKEHLALVGRGSRCQLQLLDPTVSRVQFVFIEREGLYYLSPVSTNPTIVDGVAVNREVEIMPGSEIRLSADTLLKFELQDGGRDDAWPNV
jgi:hypothetical protein